MKKWENVTFEEIIRAYIDDVLETEGKSPKTVDKIYQAVNHWEKFNQKLNADRKKITIKKASGFVGYLDKIRYGTKPVGLDTRKKIISNIRNLFQWTLDEFRTDSGIKSKTLKHLRLNRAQLNQCNTSKIKKYPDIVQIRDMLLNSDAVDLITQRVKSLISFLFMSGCRIETSATMQIGAIDLEEMTVDQDPNRGIRTKNSKPNHSTMINFDPDIASIFVNWVQELRKLGFSGSDPLFPRCSNKQEKDGLMFTKATGWTKEFLSPKTLNKHIKEFGRQNAYPDLHPHAIRHSHMAEALKLATTGEEIKAITQNVGHEDITTVFKQYGNQTSNHVHEIIKNLHKNRIPESTLDDLKKKILKKVMSLNGKYDSEILTDVALEILKEL